MSRQQPMAGRGAASSLSAAGAGDDGLGDDGLGDDGTGDDRAGGAAAVPARPARRRADPWRAAFLGVLILAILAGVAWALLGSSLLVVRHVVVTGNRLVSVAQVRSAARIPAGQPLARVNTAAAARRVEQIAPVLSASVSRSWPDTIVVTVHERTPQLAVAAASGYDLVDSHGVTVLWMARKPAGMPLLTSPPAVLRGSPDVRAAALVLGQLPGALRQRVLSVSAASATTVTLKLGRGVTVLWGSPGQAAQKSEELDLLLRTHARFYDVSDPSTAVTQG
jgi:cell division protein FtsQ